MNTFGDMYVLALPGLALQNATGMDLRIQVGYYDEIIPLPTTVLVWAPAAYRRISISLRKIKKITVSAGNSFNSPEQIVRLYDNMKTRDVHLVVTNTKTSIPILFHSPQQGPRLYFPQVPIVGQLQLNLTSCGRLQMAYSIAIRQLQAEHSASISPV